MPSKDIIKSSVQETSPEDVVGTNSGIYSPEAMNAMEPRPLDIPWED